MGVLSNVSQRMLGREYDTSLGAYTIIPEREFLLKSSNKAARTYLKNDDRFIIFEGGKFDFYHRTNKGDCLRRSLYEVRGTALAMHNSKGALTADAYRYVDRVQRLIKTFERTSVLTPFLNLYLATSMIEVSLQPSIATTWSHKDRPSSEWTTGWVQFQRRTLEEIAAKLALSFDHALTKAHDIVGCIDLWLAYLNLGLDRLPDVQRVLMDNHAMAAYCDCMNLHSPYSIQSFYNKLGRPTDLPGFAQKNTRSRKFSSAYTLLAYAFEGESWIDWRFNYFNYIRKKK